MENQYSSADMKDVQFRWSTLGFIALILFTVGFVTGLGIASKVNPCVVVPTISIQRDTVTRIDTLKGQIMPPEVRTIIRRDTLLLPSKQDTTYKATDTSKAKGVAAPQAYVTPSGGISIPIEQRTYRTAAYKAVISGWHPNLDSMEVYQQNRTITETVTKLAPAPRRNWAVTIGPSATYTTDRKFVPGASVVLGFVVKSWH